MEGRSSKPDRRAWLVQITYLSSQTISLFIKEIASNFDLNKWPKSGFNFLLIECWPSHRRDESSQERLKKATRFLVMPDSHSSVKSLRLPNPAVYP